MAFVDDSDIFAGMDNYKLVIEMFFKPKYFVFLLSVLFGVSLRAQSVKSQNNDIWLHYLGKNMLNEKWSFTLEATMRYANGFSEKQQWFVRPSVDYQFKKQFSGSIGYSYYNTYSYGNPALNKIETPENHVWIQGTYVHNSGDFKFTQRLRNEHRFVGIAQYDAESADYEIDYYQYRNRLRYLFLVNYPLLKKDSQVKLTGFLGNEAFINIGTNAGKTFFNQNRVIMGLGYNFNSHHQLQLSYIHQHIWNFSNTILESNPTIRVSYLTNFDL